MYLDALLLENTKGDSCHLLMELYNFIDMNCTIKGINILKHYKLHPLGYIHSKNQEKS